MLSSNQGVEGVAPAGAHLCHPDRAHHEHPDGQAPASRVFLTPSRVRVGL